MNRLIRPVALGLLVLAGAEFLLLRLLLRTGPMLPEGAWVGRLMEVVYRLGIGALNLALLAAVVLLSLLVVAAARAPERTRGLWLPVLCAVAGVFALIGAMAPAALVQDAAAARTILAGTMAASLAAMAVAGLAGGPAGRRRWLVWHLLLIYALLYGHYLLRSAGVPALAPQLAGMAEGLIALVPALALWVLRPGPRRRAALAAAMVALPAGGFYAAQPDMWAAFGMWNLGLTSWLPGWVYVAALALFVYTVVAAATRPRADLAALGLAIAALGGMRVDDTYFNLLALTGLLLAFQPAAAATNVAATPEASSARAAEQDGACEN